MTKWMILWRNRQIAYEIFSWFRDIVRRARDVTEALQRLQESVRKGDLNDLVERMQTVAGKREDYLANG